MLSVSKVLGYQRTLQPSDLWKMDPSRESAHLSAILDVSWARRVEAAELWNARLDSGELKPTLLARVFWLLRAAKAGRGYTARRAELESEWRDKSGRKQPSLAWALNDTLGSMFWISGLFKVHF